MPYEIIRADMTTLKVDAKLFQAVQSFIDDHYIEENAFDQRYPSDDRIFTYIVSESLAAPSSSEAAPSSSKAAPKARLLKDWSLDLEATFSEFLLQLIDERGSTDVEVYKRANLDRKLFSKIRSQKHYQPSKATALALAVALELNFDQAQKLLQKAGLALSRTNHFDLIIEYFLTEGIYNIHQINEVLFEFNQPLLGR